MRNKNRSGIIAGGNWIVDIIKTIDTYPLEERLANILNETKSIGGSPYNVLACLHKMGVSFPLEGIGVVGSDENGELIIEKCKSMQIDTTQISKLRDISTSYTDVMTATKTGKRTFFHYRGANSQLDIGHFEFKGSRARMFHLGYLLLLDKLDQLDFTGNSGAALVLEIAKEEGFITSVDIVSEQSERYKEIIPVALPFVDFLFLNEFEARMLTDIEIIDKNGEFMEEKSCSAAEILLNLGVRQWVIIHHSKGAMALSKRGQFIYQSGVHVPSKEIKGTVGAGDAFAAGVLAGIHEDLSMQECLLSGVSVAASSLLDMTSTESVMLWSECLKLGMAWGWH